MSTPHIGYHPLLCNCIPGAKKGLRHQGGAFSVHRALQDLQTRVTGHSPPEAASAPALVLRASRMSSDYRKTQEGRKERAWSHNGAWTPSTYPHSRLRARGAWCFFDVIRIEYDPGSSAHIALVRSSNAADEGTSRWKYILATEGMRAGDQVQSFRQGIPAGFIPELDRAQA
ncbi:hypothetical protein H0H87_001077 [Tephrocybe sp. NHM501043]|nr:hypothetical protein H0H87_001077 [Tephrocybe sp. NHM501043]